jgi:hypothetical protein
MRLGRPGFSSRIGLDLLLFYDHSGFRFEGYLPSFQLDPSFRGNKIQFFRFYDRRATVEISWIRQLMSPYSTFPICPN